MALEKLILGALLLALVGCSSTAPPERRFEARELQALAPAQFAWPEAAQAARAQRLVQEREQMRRRLALPPGPDRDAALPAALQAALMFGMEQEAARAAALAELPGLPSKPMAFQHAVLGAVHALAPAQGAAILDPERFSTPREFAMAAHIVLDAEPQRAAALRAELATRADDPRLRALADAIDQRIGPRHPPPALSALFAAPLRPGLPVVFSLQRPGRGFMGLAVVRGADGRFVRQPDGRLFSIAQLARSSSAMPGTITLGNTPRGLFAVRGAGTAENPWIGPTPYLHSQLPMEASVAEFLNEPAAHEAWSESLYRSLLPEAWRDALMEAWWAGKAGRSEILMHGTTMDPAWYAGRPYWPGTPSAGCLVAGEIWDPRDGHLRASDQLRLAQAFSVDGQVHGFLLVADIEGEGAVTVDELQAAVAAAESKLMRNE